MTNKINGIDVSECEYYDDGVCCNEDVLALSCDKTDCIYKQLRLLQEENEKLKEFKKEISKPIVLSDIEEEATNKYKQALEEIRDMLKKSMNLKSNAYNHFINVEKAIDKINEVFRNE